VEGIDRVVGGKFVVEEGGHKTRLWFLQKFQMALLPGRVWQVSRFKVPFQLPSGILKNKGFDINSDTSTSVRSATMSVVFNTKEPHRVYLKVGGVPL